jgi:hypothetical protein
LGFLALEAGGGWAAWREARWGIADYKGFNVGCWDARGMKKEKGKMKTIAAPVIALALFSGLTPLMGADKDSVTGVPQYNTKTEVNVEGTIVKVTEVPAAESFGGIHITLQAKTGNVEVFLGPGAFLKMMGVTVKEGDKLVGVTGSKVKFEGEDLVLARELRIRNAVLTLRDEKGFPTWLYFTQSGITSGL